MLAWMIKCCLGDGVETPTSVASPDPGKAVSFARQPLGRYYALIAYRVTEATDSLAAERVALAAAKSAGLHAISICDTTASAESYSVRIRIWSPNR